MYTQSWQAVVGVDQENVAVVFIHYIKHAKTPSIPQTVVHKIQAPYLIGILRLEQLLLGPCRQSLFRSSTNIELQGRIDPIYPHVIPSVAHQANPVVTLPEANARMFEMGRASCRN